MTVDGWLRTHTKDLPEQGLAIGEPMAMVDVPPVETAPAARRRFWDGLPDLPARTAWRISNLPRVHAALARRHQAAQAAHRESLPVLKPIDREIVDGLNRDGVYVATLGALGLPGAGMLQIARQLASAYAVEARRRVAAGKDFVLVPPDQLADHATIFRWGLSHRLLDIAEAYLGLPVAYDGVTLNYTVADGREVSTRKWHRDWEDRRMLKVAIYIHAVDGDGGPFEMVRPCPISEGQGPVNYELASDADLALMLGEAFRDRIVSCQGPAGTVVFTDTARCFHRGKPATARDRQALFFSYFAARPRHPFFCERTGLSRAQIARLAQGLNTRQRAAALWRRGLPWWIRIIPPARL